MRDVLGIIAAGVVACLTFLINMIFLLNVLEPMGFLERASNIALVIFILWSFTTPIVAAVFTIRLVGLKERVCDVCGKPIPNNAIDWMHRIGKHGEASLWVPTHADCSTKNHREP